MADVNRGSDISQFANLSYPTTGDLNKGPRVSGADTGASGPQVITTEAGVTLTTEASVAIQTET